MLPAPAPSPEPPPKRLRSLPNPAPAPAPADSDSGSSQPATGPGGAGSGTGLRDHHQQVSTTPAPPARHASQPLPASSQRPTQPQPQSQQPTQQQQQQHRPSPHGAHGGGAGAAGGGAGSSGRNASGATAVLPTSLPDWAEAALRGVDPFWEPQETLAVIDTHKGGPAPGTHGQLQSASALFSVSPAAVAAIKEGRAQARFVCVQPDDGPPHRCHWYGGSYALVNSQPFEVTKEDRTSLLLGPNQSDQVADLSPGLHSGLNRLWLLWPVGVAGAVAALRLCARRTPRQLAAALAPPLPLTSAVAGIVAHMAGGASGGSGSGSGGGGGDGDVVGSGLVSLSLRCPLSGALAAAPAHFGSLAGGAPLAFFDTGPFLEVAERSGSWVCPVTGRLGSADDLRPHAYLAAVLATLAASGAAGRVEAIQVAPDGTWRPRDSRVPFLSVLEPPAACAFDPRLLEPEGAQGGGGSDVVDLTDD